MTKFDRYLLLLYAKIFIICFVSFTGLYIIVHLFTNFDELVILGKQEGGFGPFLIQFYGPRVLDFFDRTVGILMLVAAAFAFAFMQRRRELTAIEAAGIPKSRMVKPLIVASIFLVGFSIVNREVWMPKFRMELCSTAQNWKQDSGGDNNFLKDHLNGLSIRVRKVNQADAKTGEVVVQIPIYMSDRISRVMAPNARYLPANDLHPPGLFLERVSEPIRLWEIPSLKSSKETVVFFPKDNNWLKGNECFVATNLTLEELAFGQQLNDYASLADMIQSLQRSTQWFSRTNRIAVHSRIVRPILDLSLLLIALPLIIRFNENNLVMAASSCVGTIAIFQISIMLFQALGSVSLIKTASLAAWLPVICFLPLTVVTWRMIDRVR